MDYLAIHDVLNRLSKMEPQDIKVVFFGMLQDNKINFNDLSNIYVKYLEYEKLDLLNQLVEAETCVSEHLIDKEYESRGGRKPKGYKKDKDNHIQRSLYLLNKSNRFNTKHLNEYFNYNEEEAKKLSWYEREKNRL